MSSKGGRRTTTWGNSWKHGKTTVIRVPEVLELPITEYARQLDAGNCLVTDNAAIVLDAIDRYITWRKENYRATPQSKEPDINSRTWDELRKLQKLLQENPQALGLAPGAN
ncbi:MAG: hypothetical protein RMX68_005840 [Aulosira sp. ZfuVER01]|nr:hypothetical protein [Aulosira sp. ZfuVER01]MDZ8000496.1 hypothetical protein [Aulosira sp. DedVER01a]MDZ8052968.1 hypothetical protein [Aulosira sp. ZfuCHP01]